MRCNLSSGALDTSEALPTSLEARSGFVRFLVVQKYKVNGQFVVCVCTLSIVEDQVICATHRWERAKTLPPSAEAEQPKRERREGKLLRFSLQCSVSSSRARVSSDQTREQLLHNEEGLPPLLRSRPK
jgi:hypothetical protein